jgi:MFS family permease
MYPRALILKVSGIVGLLSCITLFFSLYIQDSNHNLGLGLLFANAILIGAYNAISGPALSSILADSVQTGARTSIYALQYAAQIGAGSAGPLIGIFFLIYLGNEWSTRNLQYVIYAGNVIVAFSCFFAFFFDDKKSLGEESEGILSPSVTRSDVSTTITTSDNGINSNSNSKSNQIDTFLVNDRNENDNKFSEIQQQAVQSSSINHDENDGLNEPFLSPVSTSSSKTKTKSKSVRIITKDETMEEEEDESNDGSIKVIKKTSSSRNLGHQTVNLGCCLLRVKHIPYLIFTSDFTIAIGAGMTVQYFSLFFANAEGLSPIAVASIWVACPLLIALTTAGVVPLAKIIGRAQAAVLCDAIGSACIFALWYDKTPVWCTIAIYLVRTAAMNSSYPIQRAILMDVIPKKDRGKWNSVENLTSFTWTGSAAAGGYLVSHFGYRFTFLITGGLYILATMILSLLIALTYGEVTDVKEEEEEEEKEGEGEEVEE